MAELVYIDKVDEIHLRIRTDRGILREMQDHFSFYADGYKFHPKFKAKAWDGKIRLLDARSGKIYVGLLDEVLRFCEDRDYEVKYDYSELADDEMSLAETNAFMEGLKSKVKITDFELRDYQVESVAHCLRKRRALLLSPTSSGKSWMIYSVIKYYLLRYKVPALVIVDSTAAVSQMRDDFIEYGEDASNIHGILGGVDKSIITPITISTWQSLLDTPKEWFDRFGTVIGDEAHHFAAKTFQALMEKITEAPYRFGFTGTIKGSKCNTMVLEGLFGKVRQLVTTKELMDKEYVAELGIKCIVFQYPDEIKKRMKKATYQQEMDFLVTHEGRNRFIKNLAGSLEGNTLIFFNFVDKHGKVLYNAIKDAFPDRRVYFIHGGVDGEIRNDVREELEKHDNCIGVVSYGTFQTAISIKNIWNMILASPSKSRIRNLQSIGRGLRRSKKKTKVDLYDLADNLILGTWKNHTIRHFSERIKTYSDEKFKPKIYNVALKG